MPKTKASRGMKGTAKRGMKKKDLEKGGSFGDTMYIKKGDTASAQFFHEPDDFLVFQQHAWEEDRKWFFVPCMGEDECPLDDDEDEDRARRGYQWAAQVYDLGEKKAKVLSGGKDLGNRVYYRYEKKPTSFTKRVFEITKFATKPITYDVAPGEDKPINLDKVKPIDLDEWLAKQVKAYYGEDGPSKASDLEEPEEEEGWEDSDSDSDDPDEDDDLSTLGEEADDDDDEAQERLTKLAEENDLDPDDYDTWKKIAKAIEKARSSAGKKLKEKPKAKAKAKGSKK